MNNRCVICQKEFEGHFNKKTCSDECSKSLREKSHVKYNQKIKNIRRQQLLSDTLEGEIWKDVKGYEGLYEISNLGRVRSMYRQGGGGLLKTSLSKNGYLTVGLRDKNKSKLSKHMTIHQLLATHFLDNPYNYQCVDHIDRNRQNNSLINLRWVTYKENATNSSNVIDRKGCIYVDKFIKKGIEYAYWRVIKYNQNGDKVMKRFKTENEATVYFNS